MRVFRRVEVADWIVVASLAFGGVVWAVRLEGRVNAQAVALQSQDNAIATVQQHDKESIDEVRQDLSYIRTRLDQVLDGGRR